MRLAGFLVGDIVGRCLCKSWGRWSNQWTTGDESQSAARQGRSFDHLKQLRKTGELCQTLGA
eukprot:5324483-Amphidinium_carterae.1